MFANAHCRLRRAAGLIAVLLLAAACGRDEAADEEQAGNPAATDAATSTRPVAEDSLGPAPTRPVDSERLPYAEIDDQLVYGHFAFPSDMIEPLPAVIVVHDLWGLTDEVRALSDRLAAEGYMVLAVDLFNGATFDADTRSRANRKAVELLENPDLAAANISQALEFVGIAGAPGKASLGWGLGGAWSLNATMMFPDELDAAIIYYGQVISDEEELAKISTPVLGLFGARDREVTVDSVTEFEAAMRRLRKDYVVQVYPGVGARFADSTWATFDAEAARDAWQRTVDFLAAKLAADAS
ncbi:MAG: dienelactone hydrolase family protein [Woeseiaceae bacterium]|nr:dienelactone hydrolase family protein [Woeseiaceae bacterium]